MNNYFGMSFVTLTGTDFYRIVFGIWQEPPLPLRSPGTGKGLFPKEIPAGLFSGLLQEFLVRAPGRLLKKIVI